MKLFCALAAAVAALVLTATASAQAHHQQSWHKMTLIQKRAVVLHDIHVHRSAVRWWIAHRLRQPLASAPYIRCRAIGIRAPGPICVHGQRLVDALHVKSHIDATLAALAQARLLAARPAHYDLWLCIHGGEGSWHNQDTGHNSHYGGLQMTIGWDGRVGNAALLTPLAQMQAAEAGYAAHGYSKAWLQGQWGQTIGPCWKYA